MDRLSVESFILITHCGKSLAISLIFFDCVEFIDKKTNAMHIIATTKATEIHFKYLAFTVWYTSLNDILSQRYLWLRNKRYAGNTP